MKIVKTILAVAIVATASVSVAAPACSHQKNVSMTANSNPVRVAKSAAVDTTSAPAAAVRGTK